MLADLDSYDVLYLEKTLSPKDLLFDQILNSSLKTIHEASNGGATYLMGHSVLTPISSDFNELLRFSQAPGLYIRCLECPTLT